MKKFMKIVGLILLLFVIVVLAQNLGILWHAFDLYGVEYIFHGLTYLILAVLMMKWVVKKVLGKSLAYYRVTPVRVVPFCLLLGVLLPTVVTLFYLVFFPGTFIVTQFNTVKDYFEMASEGLFISGIVAPIVEEMMFRGVLLKYISDKTNIVFSLIVTSLLFGLVHLFNGHFGGIDFFLLLFGGTTAGLMFGVACYRYGTIWASVVLHICWNIGGMFLITNHEMEYGFVQYVLKDSRFWVTGGEYGVDVSVISIVGYILVTLILLFVNKNVRDV